MPLPASQITETMQRAYAPTFPNGTLFAGRLTMVFRIRSATTNLILKEHRLILAPTSFTQETESRTALYYTQGGIVADTPFGTGVGATAFQISGHTGFAGVRIPPTPTVVTLQPGEALPQEFLAGPPLPPGASLIDGAAAIKDLQDTVLAYFFPTHLPETYDEASTQDLRLEFLNLGAPISAQDPTGQVGWRIHPHRNLVTLRQDASKPFLYQYQFQFVGIGPLAGETVTDGFVEDLTAPSTGLKGPMAQLAAAGAGAGGAAGTGVFGSFFTGRPIQLRQQLQLTPFGRVLTSLRQATAFVRGVTAQINAIEKTFHDMALELFVTPVQVFTRDAADLLHATTDFVNNTRDKIAHPLYARTFQEILDLDRHSVSTLKEAAKELGRALTGAAEPRSVSRPGAGTTLVGGTNDVLTLALNHDPPVTVHLGSQASGPAIAAALQTQIRAIAAPAPPSQDPAAPPPAGLVAPPAANALAYQDFTATYDPVQSQYKLVSGTTLSDAGRVEVIVNPDPDLNPTDASIPLGLGLANGGQEQPGTASVVPTLAVLRGVEAACTHLLGFPDYFADQLEAQDAALVARLPPGSTRPQIRGDQRLRQVRIAPGESLQGLAQRVGVPWETLALVNRLTYPFILEEPTTLLQGRVSSATPWSLLDVTRAWKVNAYQGQRVDIVLGVGAGQSQRIVRNTDNTLVLEHAWDITPSDLSEYAIRSATNPVRANGQVTSATASTVTDSSRALVPGSQRGLTLVVTSGDAAGDQRQVMGNDATTYVLDRPWEVRPEPGALYLLRSAAPATLRQKLVGDSLGVPQPGAQARLPIRTRLHDVSAITGQQRSVEERLFGRDLLLDPDTMALVWDQALGDARTLAELPNLRQAMIHYINLPLSELEYAPGLGSYVAETLGRAATLPLQIELLSSVERTIRQDKRIARMANAQLVGSGGTTVILFNAVAINGSTVDRIAIR